MARKVTDREAGTEAGALPNPATVSNTKNQKSKRPLPLSNLPQRSLHPALLTTCAKLQKVLFISIGCIFFWPIYCRHHGKAKKQKFAVRRPATSQAKLGKARLYILQKPFGFFPNVRGRGNPHTPKSIKAKKQWRSRTCTSNPTAGNLATTLAEKRPIILAKASF